MITNGTSNVKKDHIVYIKEPGSLASMNRAFDEKNDMLNLEADFMHFTIERGTDIDTALEMIKQFINIQKEAGCNDTDEIS